MPFRPATNAATASATTSTLLPPSTTAIPIWEASTEDRARAVFQVLMEKAARRSLSVKLFKAGEPKTVGRGRGQIEVMLNAGISDDLARSLQKKARLVSPKVQVRVQGDQLRVTSKEKDALQAVIKSLREDESIPVPLQFVNYRG